MSKPWAESLAERIPDGWHRGLAPRDAFCFFYHVISDRALPHISHLYAYKTPQEFECDLLFLKQNFRLISYDQLVEQRSSRTHPGKPAAFLSFDDGCAECFTVVRPLLLKHEIPCTFFLTTDLIDNHSMLYRHTISLCIQAMQAASPEQKTGYLQQINQDFLLSLANVQGFEDWLRSIKREETAFLSRLCPLLGVDVGAYLQSSRPYLTLEEIRFLAADGFTIGSHSKSHPKMSLLEDEAIEEEMVASCKTIQDITHQDQVPFAFPFSAYGIRRELLERIAGAHPSLGILFDTKGIRRDHPWIQNRIWSDSPSKDIPGQSNLPRLLRAAYEDDFLWKMRRLRLYRGPGKSPA